MNAGRFDTPIEIWRYTTSVNSTTGERLKSWTKLSDAWSIYEPADGGTEGVYADTRENKQTVNFTIRYTAVGVNDRIVLNGQNYNIISFKMIERDMYIKLMTQLTQ
jgi:SPP1 family predicted phage head-tail adaptor